jgi:hypothetical protein
MQPQVILLHPAQNIQNIEAVYVVSPWVAISHPLCIVYPSACFQVIFLLLNNGSKAKE